MTNDSAAQDTLAARLFDLFKPGEMGHGHYTLVGDGRRDDCNIEGKLDHARKGFAHEPVTVELWQLHLEGKQGLGVVPIMLDGMVCWGAIDIDVYTGLNHAELAQKMQELGLPLIVCRSKSGGCHIYLFCSEPVPAAAMQRKLQDIAAMLGHGGSEIYPKQTKITKDDSGSWLNMPYFGALAAEGTMRYAVTPDGEPLTLEQFIAIARQNSVALDYLRGQGTSVKDGGKQDVFESGPPCLNHLATLGFPSGGRDNALYSIAVYYKKAVPGEGWEKATEKANYDLFSDPLSSAEVQKTIKSVGKKDYRYKCNDHPLAQHCNVAKCRMRKFGVGNGEAVPELGEMRVLQTKPPVFYWDVSVNGDSCTLELTGDQTLNPRLFAGQVWKQMQKAVSTFKQSDWNKLLNETRKVNIDVPEDASVEGQCWELIERFATYNPADSLDEVLNSRAALSDGRVYFQLSSLIRYLASQGFKDYKPHELGQVLRMRKDDSKQPVARDEQIRVKGKKVRLWSIPEPETQQGHFEVPDAIRLDERPF